MTTATDTKRRALGKGLDSLLPRVQTSLRQLPLHAKPRVASRAKFP